MKMKRTAVFSIIGGALLTLNSCDLVKDFTYNVNPNPLEMHGDSVKISVVVNVPAKGIHKKVKAEITPTFASKPLGTWVVQGEKVTGNGKTIAFKPGGSATFDLVLPYDAAYEAAELKLTGKVFKGNKEKETLPEVKIADGTIITPLLVQKDCKMIFEEDAIVRSFSKTFDAKINFDRSKSIVKPTELKDKDILELVSWLSKAQSDSKVVIKSIEIKGYASPDGEEAKNVTLSFDRAREARTAIIGLMKKNKLTAFTDTTKYAISKFGEDFDGFKAQLAATNSISEADKNLFIRILEMSKDAKQRETEMINLGKSYTALEKEVFPSIRRTSIIVNYTVSGLTDEELKTKSVSMADSLGVEELLFVAGKLTNDINEKARLYEVAAKNFPSDFRTNNNLGAIKYLQNKMPEAKVCFEKAISAKDNASSKNNMASILIIEGDRVLARKLLGQAKGSKNPSAVSSSIAILDILDGKYSAAASQLKENSFNKALTSTLLNNYEDAKKALNGVNETAETDYLKAIISARSGEGSDAVVNHLKNAFSKDASLKEKASKDREFIKLFNDSNFSSVIQ